MALSLSSPGDFNRLLNNFGLSSTWDLDQCYLQWPDNLQDINQSFGGVFSDIFQGGLNRLTFIEAGSFLPTLNLGVIPSAELAREAIFNTLTKSSADSAGRTKSISLNTTVSNNLINYQLPNNVEIVRNFGTKATQFTLTALIAGAGYVEKVQKFIQLSQINTGLSGIIFSHPILGTFDRCQIMNVTTNESFKAHSASFVTFTVVTPSIFTKNESTQRPTSNVVLEYINNILSIIQTLESLQNTKEQLEASLSGLANLAKAPQGSQLSISEGEATFTFEELDYNNPKIGKTFSGGSKIKSNNVFGLSLQNINDILEIPFQINRVLDVLCRNLDIEVRGYGTGFVTNVENRTQFFSNINNLQLIENTEIGGNPATIERTVITFENGLYEVNIKTTIFIPNQDNSLSNALTLIDNIITTLNVVVELLPDQYPIFSQLIANLEGFYDYSYNRGDDRLEIKKETTLTEISFKNNVSVEKLLTLNPELIGSKLLLSGMELSL